jgi:hypothetical protein
MKQVFNTNEVAHIWANQQQNEGRNSAGNFYFRGQTIYSYGGHFPIATINDNTVFFTLRSYSNTTAKHIQKARAAVSHKTIIYCIDVPENFKYLTAVHEANLNYWKKNIKAMFAELGNKRNKAESRVNTIGYNVAQLQAYCSYFKMPVKDKELKDLLKLAASPDFVNEARQAGEKAAELTAKRMKQAVKAFEQYISLWREYKDEEIKELPSKVKDLCNFYNNNQQAFTRLRYNTAENRLETSKGVQIPAEIAKRAYIQLNGCMEGNCKDISVPVLHYTITETTKDTIKAGCHTIPKTDITYIANLLKW